MYVKGTAPVMSYEPNSYGLYNMVGNVWEWVEGGTYIHTYMYAINAYCKHIYIYIYIYVFIYNTYQVRRKRGYSEVVVLWTALMAVSTMQQW